jgi:hypothetical protein
MCLVVVVMVSLPTSVCNCWIATYVHRRIYFFIFFWGGGGGERDAWGMLRAEFK